MTIFKNIKILILSFVLFYFARADLRFDYNDLSAEGNWTIISREKFRSQQWRSYRNNKNSWKNNSRKVNSTNISNQTSNTKNETIEQNEEADQYSSFNFTVLDYLQSNGGLAYCFFYDSNIVNQIDNKSKVDSLSIRFHNPKYIDENILILKIPLFNFSIDTQSWQKQRAKVNFTYFQNLQLKKNGTIRVSYWISRNIIEIKFRRFVVTIDYIQIQYSFILPMMVFAFNIFILYLVYRIQTKDIPCEKLSLFSLFHFILFLLYLATFFLIIGISSLPKNPLSLLMLTVVVQIVIVAKIIQKFQNIVERIADCRKYAIFYLGIFLYIYLLFNYYYSPIFIILNSLFAIPQIVHTIRFGNKLGFQYQYLAVLSSNQFYFLYLKGYSENYLKFHPQIEVCVIVLLLIVFQLWFIWKQNVQGPYFFIKKQWLPNYHEYYKTYEVNKENNQILEQQCAICLCNYLDASVAQFTQSTEIQLKARKEPEISSSNTICSSSKSVILMQTPCGHRFHIDCLESWMDYKRQCPNDRSVLPVIYKN